MNNELPIYVNSKVNWHAEHLNLIKFPSILISVEKKLREKENAQKLMVPECPEILFYCKPTLFKLHCALDLFLRISRIFSEHQVNILKHLIRETALDCFLNLIWNKADLLLSKSALLFNIPLLFHYWKFQSK